MLDEAGFRGTVTGIFSPILNRQSYADPALGRRCRTFFLNGALRRHAAEGLVDFCPWTYGQMGGWFSSPGRFDAAVVMVSEPDDQGRYSLGVQADFLADFRARMARLIGVVDPRMPRTDAVLEREAFTALFDLDQPLLAMADQDGAPDPMVTAIADNVAALVPDGATLQIGIGRIPQAVSVALRGHRGLKIHSGLVDDNVDMLDQAGALDPETPIVTGVAIGQPGFYDRLDRNPRYTFRRVSFTNGGAVLAQTPRLFAINGALEIELHGGDGERHRRPARRIARRSGRGSHRDRRSGRAIRSGCLVA